MDIYRDDSPSGQLDEWSGSIAWLVARAGISARMSSRLQVRALRAVPSSHASTSRAARAGTVALGTLGAAEVVEPLVYPAFVRIDAQHERAGLSQFLAVLVQQLSLYRL